MAARKTKAERNKAASDGIADLMRSHGKLAYQINPKRGYAKGKALRIPVSVQLHYSEAIGQLTDRMVTETRTELVDLLKSEDAVRHFYQMSGQTVGMDASLSSQARILMNKLKAKYDQLFGKLSFGLSPKMADDLNRASSTATRSSVAGLPNLKEASKTLTLSVKQLDEPTKNILKAASGRSANFITSIPEQHLGRIANAVYDSITTGNGLEDLIPALDKEGSSIKNWARNTAMDQTRKTYNGLNAGRMKKIGIEKGEWIHSGGSQHPRELHQEYDGQTFNLNKGAPVGDDDGNYVMPGDDANCRCTFAPVIDFGSENEDDADDDEE